MLKLARNIQKPDFRDMHLSLAHSSRNEAVTGVVQHVNRVLNYAGSDIKLDTPGQSNIDERMPLYFMRPCIPALNEIIKKYSLDKRYKLKYLPEVGDSIDYHGVILMANDIINHANKILELL